MSLHAPARATLDLVEALSLGPQVGTGSHLPSQSLLGQWDGTGLGQPRNEKFDLGFFPQLLHMPYLPQAPHQQLVAYCFFKKKVDFNAVNFEL